MKLTAAELACVRSQGLYITDKCDGCGKVLNQTVRWTIAGKREVYCSAACRDLAFFGDPREAKKHTTPGKCVYCGGTLEGKRRGALYCDESCKKRAARKGSIGGGTPNNRDTDSIKSAGCKPKNSRARESYYRRAAALRTRPRRRLQRTRGAGRSEAANLGEPQ